MTGRSSPPSMGNKKCTLLPPLGFFSPGDNNGGVLLLFSMNKPENNDTLGTGNVRPLNIF
jgi:hypothetical protein